MLAAALASTTPVRWLGATAIHSEDRSTPMLISSLEALCEHHIQLHVLVNFFDAKKLDPASIVQMHSQNTTARVEGTWVPGMKTLFWYKFLTPERTQHLDLVWVFDCDIAVHPSVFPLGQLAGVLRWTRATILQPSIQALVHGTYHPWLRVKKAHMSCLATTAQWCEMQTPLFAGDAWARFHRKVLSIIPEEGLVTSDFGLDIIWCAFLKDEFPTRPACLVTPMTSATHLNSHAIETYMSKEVISKERSCTTTCKTLFNHFKSFWKNFSHHTGECYSVSGHRGLLPTRSHYAVDGDGMIRARHGHGGLTQGRAAETPAEETDAALTQMVRSLPRGFGITSMDSKDRRIGPLAAALSRLCNAMPGLKIILNIQEPETGKMPQRTNRKLDVSLDARITTSWLNGPRSLIWKQLLTPELIADPVEFVWLFDPSLGVHPSVNPLPQLIHVLKSTEAAIVFARLDGHSLLKSAHAAGSQAEGPSCTASTVRSAPLGPMTVFKAEAWRQIHGNVLSRIDDSQLAQLEPGFEMLFCGIFGRRYNQLGRPVCVESHLIATRIDAGGARSIPSQLRTDHRCDPSTCANPLRRMYSLAFNVTAHEDGRCWVAGPKGLTLARWTRRPPDAKVRGGRAG